MRTLAPDLRRAGPRLATFWLACAAALGVAAWHIPEAFRESREVASAVGRLTPLERTLLPARSFDLSTDLFVAADRRLPRTATFYVATGDGIEVSSPLVLPRVPVFAAYWLLPRRLTPDPRRADWVLSYGGDLQALGLDYARVIEVAPGQRLAEVRR